MLQWFTASLCGCDQFRSQLPLSCHAFFNVPLIARDAVEGVQIRQPAESRSSAKQLHLPSAIYATRRLRRGLVAVFAVHDTIPTKPSCQSYLVSEHYRRVAG